MPDLTSFHYPRIQVSGSLPEMIESALYNVLYEEKSRSLTIDKINEVVTNIQLKKNPDYERDWASFSYLYFAANYVKAFLAARAISLPITRPTYRILDLGCGAGAATVGVISALNSISLEFENLEVEIVGVDKSPDQLVLYSKVTKPWINCVLPNVTIDTIQEDIFKYLEDGDSLVDLVILSYLTTELTTEENILLRKLLRKKFQDGRGMVLIIDSDPEKHGVRVELIDGSCWRVPYDDVNLQLPLLESLNMHRSSKFSSNSGYKDILYLYFDAWKNHDVCLIKKIFDPHATYEILGSKILDGIDEITSYWEHNSRTQRNVECILEKVNVVHDGIVANWSATFDRVDCGERRQLIGILRLVINNNKIKELSEAYVQFIELM